jgi:hypothetical protein
MVTQNFFAGWRRQNKVVITICCFEAEVRTPLTPLGKGGIRFLLLPLVVRE